MESFKIYFGNGQDNIRRVALPRNSFSEVNKQLYDVYKNEGLYHGELRIQYVDEEGDKITVSSQGEWEEMLTAAGAARPIKLWIAEGMKPRQYFKDGPAPEPVKLVVDGDKAVPITGEVANTVSIVVDCLKGVFPGGVILPYNLPDWLKSSNAITLKSIPEAEVPTEDFIVDLVALSAAMRRRAHANITPTSTPEQLGEAKTLLETVLALFPADALSYYNLACANALLGNSETAVTQLEYAFKNGYNDIEHMEKDSDLESLRGTQQYKDLVSKMNGNSTIEDVTKGIEDLKVENQEEEKMAQDEVVQEKPAEVVVVKEEENPLVSLVPCLTSLGISAEEAMALLQKHQGDLESAADEFYGNNQ